MSALSSVTAGAGAEDRDAVLGEIEQRVRWLSTAIIDHANRVRPNPTGLKVGGHQASSVSVTTLMTALWFEHLRAGDRVSVKPHSVVSAALDLL
jgi:pyruvate dehydrogenase E1 component